MRGGGFLLADGSGPLFARSFGEEMAHLFGAQALQPVPPAHPLYASFYRLDAPQGRTLHAVSVKGRIRVLYSNNGYARAWEAGAPGSLRLAVNIIHYALGA